MEKVLPGFPWLHLGTKVNKCEKGAQSVAINLTPKYWEGKISLINTVEQIQEQMEQNEVTKEVLLKQK